ncbi:hypothetical protein BD309DRAFT_987036 [Dichomitus squalens]|uniref:SH3 domain-containing protein n=2 Tax=Dichomitus squalens TaxID=114155 RepID=A0A4Q9MNW1_9APHY|nr:uncharacterized protein DICSQDRAFT_148149 [Dichomitus squalens LYAD-421 SS1]EJF60028.1 hypothetical protein DICSQDRAFT_148149 [Dichomitus squalens LYAD-421 SS1]TBU29185.1 hypothetical protein BD311DRAFT_777751 [Dichomitus squalens]TBU48773.1 hypothetical protein BD309DRAFT_987036 [Dichomitus squalens]TBU57825.1 hypothetical protein BD310DRAFT_820758 [Dichomitus squalens]
MASVVAQDTAELRLTLPVERASTSPFPSPGSPFYPPPRLGAHEFASRPSSSRSSNGTRDSSDNKDKMPLTDGAITPTGTVASSPSLSVTLNAASPTTPTPGSAFQVKTPTTQITMPEPPSNSETPVSLNAAAAALTNSSNRDSLTSSRPAPPSPAVSRRASAALSRHSSTARSRRQSKGSFLQASHEPEPSTSSTNTVTPTPSSLPRPHSLLFKIRDFAFPPSDDRHTGRGPDAPRPNRPRKRWSTYSTMSQSSVDSSRADDEEDAGQGEWGKFPWNTLSSRFSWGQQEGGASRPSQSDLDNNFNVSSPTEEQDDPYGDEYDEGEYEYEDAQGGEEALVPGLYRALYAFEPEGTAEMALEEEQIVHVVGRGGGVGWAVVEREGGGHALVPESYLELVEAD